MAPPLQSAGNDDNTLVFVRRQAASGSPAPFDPCLVQMSGSELGRMYRLAGRRFRIGRSPECEIFYRDPHISRCHAELMIGENGEVRLRDLGSCNGVFVNGCKVLEAVLQDGDKLLIGETLQFKFTRQDSLEQSFQQRLFQAANFDALTGVYCRGYFNDVLAKEFSFSQRAGQSLSLLLLDLDYFKRINDGFGHDAGDAVLSAFAALLRDNLRPDDVACRFGGEEFAALLRATTAPDALRVAERLRQETESRGVAHLGRIIPLTVSIGAMTLEGDNLASLEEMVRTADANLYAAKRGGRNRVVEGQLR